MILLPTLEFRRRDFILNALGSAALLAAPVPVLAQETGGAGKSAVIDVNNARNAPIPVAITDLGGGPLGANISAIVTSDLARSGLFRPIDRAARRTVAALGLVVLLAALLMIEFPGSASGSAQRATAQTAQMVQTASGSGPIAAPAARGQLT